MKTVTTIGCIVSGMTGIIYAISDYAYKISTESHAWISCKVGSSCPLPAGIFDFSILDNFSISLILPLSVAILCVGIIKVRK